MKYIYGEIETESRYVRNNGISGVPEGVCQCTPIEQLFLSCLRHHYYMDLRWLARHLYGQVMNAFPFEDAVVE